MKVHVHCWVLSLAALLIASGASAQPPGSETKTVRVDCSEGDSIAGALSLPAHRLVIEISGICEGDVLIDRDRVTLMGVGAEATLTGDPAQPGPAVSISGASEVTVMDVTIRGGEALGVTARRNAEVRLVRVEIVDTPLIGLLIDQGSSALLVDSVVSDHGVFGVAVFGNSGLTVQGANAFSNNGQVGLLLSDGSGLHTQGGGTLGADDNGFFGVVLQAGAAGLFPSVSARRNGFAGLQVAFSANFSGIGSNNALSDNGVFGAILLNSSHLTVAGEVRDNGAAGIIASGGSVVSLATDVPSRIVGSPVGVILDGAVGNFDTVDIDSMELSFGTRATFGPNATVASLSCDPTVLTQGPTSCPSPVAVSGGTSRSEEVRAMVREWTGKGGLFQLPPF